jgi:hypothetical protein
MNTPFDCEEKSGGHGLTTRLIEVLIVSVPLVPVIVTV